MKREYGFEVTIYKFYKIFGLDFMIDDSFKPWLIEVNTNPALDTSCPICLRVIPPMLENAFRYCLLNYFIE